LQSHEWFISVWIINFKDYIKTNHGRKFNIDWRWVMNILIKDKLLIIFEMCNGKHYWVDSH
jgi:hypothetical protein